VETKPAVAVLAMVYSNGACTEMQYEIVFARIHTNQVSKNLMANATPAL
jgi:hypothetical protein